MDEILAIYIDDSGDKMSNWVRLLEEREQYVKFLDKQDNEITVPWHRILKLKKRGEPINE